MCRKAPVLENRRVLGQAVVIRPRLHLADQSLAGRASDATGVEPGFAGWMGMVAAVHALLARRAMVAPEGHPIRPAEEGDGWAAATADGRRSVTTTLNIPAPTGVLLRSVRSPQASAVCALLKGGRS